MKWNKLDKFYQDGNFRSYLNQVLTMKYLMEEEETDNETTAAIIAAGAVVARLTGLMVDDLRRLHSEIVSEMEKSRRQAAAIRNEILGHVGERTENAILAELARLNDRLERMENTVDGTQ